MPGIRAGGSGPVDASLPSRETLEGIVRRILEVATDLGATAAEAGVSCDVGLSVTVRMGEVESLEFHRDRGLGVSVYFGHRKGSASTSDLSDAAIRETVQAACDIARYTSEDECAGLAPAERMAKEIPELDLYHPWPLRAEEGIEIARRCEDIARAHDPRIHNSEGATLATHEGERVYGNTHGFLGGYPSTRHSLSCSVLAEQGGQMQRDYWFTVARDPAELQSPEEVGRIAAERTVHRLGARRIPTCQAPVLFAADVATGLFRSFVAAIRGGNLYRRSSFLLDHLGKPVFPAFLQIEELPHLPRGLGSAPFDSEGVATQRRAIVTDGILRGYVLDSYSACKLGMETTGNAGGVHNLTVCPGQEDFATLLRRMDRGLLVTELMGQGVNLVTGDYSRGAAGFWVENGEVAYPVHEITIAGNLARMFLDIEAVGSDLDLRGNIRSGSVRIREMTIAGD